MIIDTVTGLKSVCTLAVGVKLIKVYEFVPHLLCKHPVKPHGNDKHKLLMYSLNVRVFHIASGKVTPKTSNAKEGGKSHVQSAGDEILSSGSRGKNFCLKTLSQTAYYSFRLY